MTSDLFELFIEIPYPAEIINSCYITSLISFTLYKQFSVIIFSWIVLLKLVSRLRIKLLNYKLIGKTPVIRQT